MTPLKAIRAKCLDCSAGSAKEVRLCPVKSCPLWEYRFGKRPQTVKRHEGSLDGRKGALFSRDTGTTDIGTTETV